MTALARTTILSLLHTGVEQSRDIEAGATIREQEDRCRQTIGYLFAAEALLNAHPALHDELIEHPDFMLLRRVRRGHTHGRSRA